MDHDNFNCDKTQIKRDILSHIITDLIILNLSPNLNVAISYFVECDSPTFICPSLQSNVFNIFLSLDFRSCCI